jgi:hypothetical protein
MACFLDQSHMEIAPVTGRIEDLQQRVEALRGYL